MTDEIKKPKVGMSMAEARSGEPTMRQEAQERPVLTMPIDMSGANEQSAPTSLNAPSAPQEAKPDEKRLTYEEMYKRLNPYKPPTDEEVAKERKKQKREQLFASISDGISALSNLYFTTKDAPHMFDPKHSQSAVVKANYERLRAERDANMRAYLNGLMQAKKQDQDEASAREAQAYKRHRDDVDDNKWLATFQQRGEKNANDKAYQDGRLSLDGRKLEQADRHHGDKLKQADKHHTADLGIKRGQLDVARTNANANMIRANNDTVKTNIQVRNGGAGGRANKEDDVPIYYGNEETVYIPKNVYRANQGRIYTELVKRGVGKGKDESDRRYTRKMNSLSGQEREAFIANHISDPSVRGLVEELSRVNPTGEPTPKAQAKTNASTAKPQGKKKGFTWAE